MSGESAAGLSSLRSAVPREARDAVAAAARRLRGDYGEDEWGYRRGFATASSRSLGFLYSPLVARQGDGGGARPCATGRRCSSPITRASCRGTR